ADDRAGRVRHDRAERAAAVLDAGAREVDGKPQRVGRPRGGARDDARYPLGPLVADGAAHGTDGGGARATSRGRGALRRRTSVSQPMTAIAAKENHWTA